MVISGIIIMEQIIGAIEAIRVFGLAAYIQGFNNILAMEVF